MSTQTINVLCGSCVTSRHSQTLFCLQHLNVDFFSIVLPQLFLQISLKGWHVVGNTGISQVILLSAAGLGSVLDYSIFVEMLILILA